MATFLSLFFFLNVYIFVLNSQLKNSPISPRETFKVDFSSHSPSQGPGGMRRRPEQKPAAQMTGQESCWRFLPARRAAGWQANLFLPACRGREQSCRKEPISVTNAGAVQLTKTEQNPPSRRRKWCRNVLATLPASSTYWCYWAELPPGFPVPKTGVGTGAYVKQHIVMPPACLRGASEGQVKRESVLYCLIVAQSVVVLWAFTPKQGGAEGTGALDLYVLLLCSSQFGLFIRAKGNRIMKSIDLHGCLNLKLAWCRLNQDNVWNFLSPSFFFSNGSFLNSLKLSETKKPKQTNPSRGSSSFLNPDK